MYFASRFSSSSIKVLTWPESERAPTCPPSPASLRRCRGVRVRRADGLNPCGRADTRMQTGWVTASELGFMWNAGVDVNHPYPYTRVAILNPARPRDHLAAGHLQRVGGDAVSGDGRERARASRRHDRSARWTCLTSLRAIIRDDLSPDVTTAGWELFPVAEGNSGPTRAGATTTAWSRTSSTRTPGSASVTSRSARAPTPDRRCATSGSCGSATSRRGNGQAVTLVASACTAAASEATARRLGVTLTTSDGLATASPVTVNYATANGNARRARLQRRGPASPGRRAR